MIHAYDQMYLTDAMQNLGEAFDYAFSCCKINLDDFMSLFISTGYASCYEKGNVKIIAGMSGTELVMEVVSKSGMKMEFPPSQIEYDYSAQYWCGWILAYYQWKTNISFKEIHKQVSMKEIIKLYPTLHEANEEKFEETVNKIIANKTLKEKGPSLSRLQDRRKKIGLTQAELAKKAKINLRTLQQYENNSKNINNASVQSVIALAKVLKCNIEDILHL